MSDYWKLNINDYSLGELKQLFELKEPHTLEDVINSDEKFKKQIAQDDKMDKTNKEEIIRFLERAKELLIEDQKKTESHLVQSHVHTGNGHMLIKKDKDTFSKTNVNTLQSLLGHSGGGPSQPTYQRFLSIDSQFRKDYYNTLSTDFLIDLPCKLTKIVAMQLTGLEFPNTYYQISKASGNNFFWLGWQSNLVDVPGIHMNWYFINIQDGSYSRSGMETEINEQIQKATGLDSESCPQCTIDLTRSNRTIFALPTTIANPNTIFQLAFNRIRGNYTVTAPVQHNASLPPIDTAQHNIIQNLGWILGFRLAEYKASSAYVSEGMYDTWGIRYVYVVVDDFNKNFVNLIEPVYNSSLGRDNILGRVSLSPIVSALSSGTSLADSLQISGTRTYFGPVDIDKLRITICDQYGRILNLNSMDISLSIALTILYS